MCLPWRLAAQDPPVASTGAPYALNTTWDSDRSVAVLDHRDHRPLYRLSTVTVETLGAHHTLTEEESTAASKGATLRRRTRLSHSLITEVLYRELPRRGTNYTLTWRDVCATRPRLSLPAFLRRGRKTGRTGTNDGRRGRFFDGYLANQTEMPAGYSRQSRWNARMFGVRHTIRLWLCYTIR